MPHHLIDVAEISEPFDAAKFVALAIPAAREIRARGRVPIFCGGTGLYFKALLEGLGEAPPADAALRKNWKRRLWRNCFGNWRNVIQSRTRQLIAKIRGASFAPWK